MDDIRQILKEYEVDYERGFLPSQDPITDLSRKYSEWEDLAKNLTSYINAGVVREHIDKLTIIEKPRFDTQGEWERAMLLLSVFAHAYVHSPTESKTYIPECIAIPWIHVATELKRKPVLSHPSMVLNNWKRLDPEKPIQLDNLSTIFQFHGSLDEGWFYLVTVEIEAVGAKAIPFVLHAMKSVDEGDYTRAANFLKQALPALEEITLSLNKMYSNCDPHIFYNRVRPFLASFENINYKGTSLPLQNHHGGSAAQSSLLQFFDAAFGIEYEDEATREYLRLMRHHMPFKHAAFLSYVEGQSSIKKCISKNTTLESAYKKAIDLIIEFRNEHLKMVALYIMKQAKQSGAVAKGTGGTNPMMFLKSVRNQNLVVYQDPK